MDILWQTVLAVIMSVGGIGVVFVAVIHFSSNIIAERLQKKYDLKLNEEFEKYKAGIENKKHINKTKFETEFSIYRELTKVFFKMIKDVNLMIPDGIQHVPSDKAEREKFELELYKKASNSAIIAQDVLIGNSPFIPEMIFKEYEAVMRLCRLQLIAFECSWESAGWTADGQRERIPLEAYKRTGEINDTFGKLNNQVREYLDRLDVLE